MSTKRKETIQNWKKKKKLPKSIGDPLVPLYFFFFPLEMATIDVTLPALNMLKMPARFLSFMAVNVPLFDSDLRIPLEDVRLIVEWRAPLLTPPPPLLDESEPTLPLRILLRSSKGTSSGGEKPDLYRSITNRESCNRKLYSLFLSVWGNKEVTFSGSTLSAARIIPSRHLLMMGKTLRSISTPLRIKFSICLILLSSNSWRVWKTPGSAVCVREEKTKKKKTQKLHLIWNKFLINKIRRTALRKNNTGRHLWGQILTVITYTPCWR